MACVAAVSVVVETVALPVLSSALVPIVTPSLVKVTMPVGVPAPGATAATVAVKVTDPPTTLGFSDEATAVVVFALFTTCMTTDDVEPANVMFAAYTTVRGWV